MAKILLIDDDPQILENVKILLQNRDFDVITASNGKVGIELAQDEKPDLIICDIMMKDMDGYAVIKEIQSHYDLALTPFVFLTARSGKADVRLGMELGADDFITKPFSPDELFNSINTRLEKKSRLTKESESRLLELRLNLATSLPHELRTPLNGIMASSQFLMHYLNVLNREEIETLHSNIFKSAKRLEKLISNNLFYANLELILSDIKRIDELKKRVTEDAEYTIRTVLSELRSEYKTIEISIDLISTQVRMHEEHFRKIMRELIENAFKFTISTNPVTIKMDKSSGNLSISVINYGREMAQSQIDQIGAYVQFDRTVFEQQGSGLGLIIVKRLIQLYDGKLNISSNYGKTELEIVLKS